MSCLIAGSALANATLDVGEADLHGGDLDVAVTLDAEEQSGNAVADVRIHASRDIVWALITSCGEAVKLVPGLIACDVLDTTPDRSQQTIRHVMDYSWYLPKLTYQLRAVYDRPRRVTVERVAGDLKTLRGTWDLRVDGEFTKAHYTVTLAPGFWVPKWLVRAALKRDLPKMLRALRTRAEQLQTEKGR